MNIMGFLFKRKKYKETVAIFDIGSGSVGGAILNVPNNIKEIPCIVNSVRTEIDYYENKIDSSLFTRSMLRALNLTVDKLFNNNSITPDKIMCVVTSPWYSSETKIIKVKKESSFIFTKKIAEDLIKKEIKKTTITHSKKDNTIYNELEIIEHFIMRVSLNGYQIESPLGLKTKSVEMNIITSFSQKFFLDKIRKVISKTYHEIPISFSSFITNYYFSIRNKYISPESYLLLDIGGEITEVGIVSKEILKDVLSFPFGKKTFLKQIGTKLKIELRDAKELFNLYSSGFLSKEKKKEVTSIFKSIESSWNESFQECIENLPYTLALPDTIFLTADSDIIDYFSNIINNEEFIQEMTVEHKSKVIPIRGSEFLDICKYKEKIIRDPFLTIEAVSIIKNNKQYE